MNKNRITTYLLSLLFVLVLSFSCTYRPREVLNGRRMEKLLYDLYLAEAVIEDNYQEFDTPQKKEAYIDNILKKHNVTRQEWDTSLSWYSDRIDIYLRINDSVKSRLKRELAEQNALQETITRLMDQQIRILNDVSYIPKQYCFLNPNIEKGFSFMLTSHQIEERLTDSIFSFSFDVFGMPDSLEKTLKMQLSVDYSDTTLYFQREIENNSRYSLRAEKYLQIDSLTTDTVSAIKGFVHLSDDNYSDLPIILYNISLGNRYVDMEKSDGIFF